ncbi:unnamed protein product [Strongylus vulgaris]|uniref:GSKIP domain-containing protein n=1 Tax=Strongylus vulgaris TaxID=40348 RepID=A0A3P7J0Y5_STRVU|nr:unnamed protein product [Strongylus vulgaris]
MSHSETSSPPPTPSHSPIHIKGGYQSPPCICGSVPLASLSANTLADSLGVSPKTPLSLEDIANMNRKRHFQEGGVIRSGEADGPLELEAIAAVHELSHEVQDISVSEMLPRTSDLIFVNVKTQEGQPYTLELTLKGWRIASSHTDCMNGDYTKVRLQFGR